MIELSVGIIIGIILGATAMSLCAAAKMCDEYCKYPTLVDSREDLFADDSPCMKCPLTRL